MKVQLAAVLAVVSLSGSAFGGDHPRKEEVNARLANQNKRIKNGVKNGELTKEQAAQLHAEDHALRTEEKLDSAAHGGHITKGEKKALNQQENEVSTQIHEEKHP